MNWKLVGLLVPTLIIKLIGTSLFLLYFSEIFPEVPKSTSGKKTSCSIRWTLYDGNCYFFSTLEKTWDDSKNECAQWNSHLAVINSQAELFFLISSTQNGIYFIGLRKLNQQWRWIDNTKLDPSVFNTDNQTYDCAMIGLKQKFSTRCSDSHRWICENSLG